MNKRGNLLNSKDVQINLDENGRGNFVLLENGEETGLMVIGIKGSDLTAYHTEVSKKLQDQGVTLNQGPGLQLIEAMVAYAKEHQLLIIPLCPYVHEHFRKNPE